MRMIRRSPRTIRLVVLLGTWVCISVAVPLECQLQQLGVDGTGPIDEQGQVFSSQIITCQFRVLEGVPEISETTSSPHQYDLDQICLEDIVTNENGSTRRTTCLRGTLELTVTNSPLEKSREEQHISPPSTGSSDNKRMEEEEGIASSTSTVPPKRKIVVGRATYHEPYSEQTSRVAAVLHQAPSNDESQQEWIDWYIQLAAAHHPTMGQDPANDEVWIQIELTINAYQKAIEAIERLEKQTSTAISFGNQVLLASCYFHLGGSYSLDPENRYAEQTVNALKSSYTKFNNILRYSTLETLERTAIEDRFAETCSKLGIALVSLLDPIETMPAWAKAMMMLNPSDSTQFIRGQPPPKSTTSLDAIQTYFEEAIQIFDRHFKRQDGDNQDSVENVWHRLVTEQELNLQFAVTLQQSATISSIQGRFSQAKQRFEESLKIHYSLVLAGDDAGGLYVQDPGYSQASIADLHLSLADTCLQLGDYPCAKEKYAEAMTIHLNHNVRVAPIMTMELDAEIDAHIKEAKATLMEYRTSVSGGRFRQRDGLDGSPYNGNAYLYGKDDGLEGDLLATLGTLYLSTGDSRAISYLEKARDLFAGLKEDRESLVMADLMFNLALAYYRNYEFEKSKELQWQALDLYQNLFGNGVNPYTQGLEDINDSAKWDGQNHAKMIDLDSFQDQATAQNLTKKEIKEEL